MILQIEQITHHVGKNSGKPYVKINGLYFVHDKTISDQLINRTGHAINCEVRDPQGEFPCIIKIVQNGAPINQVPEVEHVDMSQGLLKPEAKYIGPKPKVTWKEHSKVGSTINRQSALKSAVAFCAYDDVKTADVMKFAKEFADFIEDRE